MAQRTRPKEPSSSFLDSILKSMKSQDPRPSSAPKSPKAPETPEGSFDQTVHEFLGGNPMRSFYSEKHKGVPAELEFRFGSVSYNSKEKDYSYSPNISGPVYTHIKSILDSLDLVSAEETYKTTMLERSDLRMVEVYTPESLKGSTGLPEVSATRFYKKTTIQSMNANGYPMKWSLAREDPVEDANRIEITTKMLTSKKSHHVATERTIYRKSWTFNNPKHILGGWRIDLSDVNQTIIKSNNDGRGFRHTSSFYEFEIEFVGTSSKNTNMNYLGLKTGGLSMGSLVAMILICTGLLEMKEGLTKEVLYAPITQDFLYRGPETVHVIHGLLYPRLVQMMRTTIPDHSSITEYLSRTLRFPGVKEHGGFSLDVLNKPVNLKAHHLINPSMNFFVTPKVDGLRCILMVKSGKVYLIGKHGHHVFAYQVSEPGTEYTVKSMSRMPVTKTTAKGVKEKVFVEKEYTRTELIPDAIFDAELYHFDNGHHSHRIYIFDLLNIGGADIRSQPFSIRLDRLRKYPVAQIESDDFRMAIKTFQTPLFPNMPLSQITPDTDPNSDLVIPVCRRDLTLTDAMRLMPPEVENAVRTDGYIFYANDPYVSLWVPGESKAGTSGSVLQKRLEFSSKLKQVVSEKSRSTMMDLAMFSDPDEPKPKTQQISEKARYGRIFKYKPANEMTIDFLVVRAKNNELRLKISGSPHQESDIKMFNNKLGDRLILKNESMGSSNVALLVGRVSEFAYDSERDIFVFQRYRPDKIQGNNVKIALDVWADIEKPMSKSTLTGTDLVLMRKSDNIFKDNILYTYGRGAGTLIDIGSGRGGDIAKWARVGFRRVYAIEPNGENRKEFSSRLKNMGKRQKASLPDITLLDFGAEESDTLLAVEGLRAKFEESNPDHVRLVTSFFSLTYFFSEESMINGLVHWLELLPVGARFIGAMLDGDIVREKLALSIDGDAEADEGEESKLGKIDTASFSIEQVGPFTSSEFGNQIRTNIKEESSMVKDQLEYLTSYAYLQEALVKAGFSEEKTGFISGYNDKIVKKLNEDGQMFSSLNRYFVFRKTRPFQAESSSDARVVSKRLTMEEGPHQMVREDHMVRIENAPRNYPDAEYYLMNTYSSEKPPDGSPATRYHSMLYAFSYIYVYSRKNPAVAKKNTEDSLMKMVQALVKRFKNKKTFMSFMEGRLYKAMEHYYLESIKLKRHSFSTKTVTFKPSEDDVHTLFLSLLERASPVLPSEAVAYILGKTFKIGVAVLSPSGYHWVLTHGGMQFKDLEGYDETFLFYKYPNDAFTVYPLMIDPTRDDASFTVTRDQLYTLVKESTPLETELEDTRLAVESVTLDLKRISYTEMGEPQSGEDLFRAARIEEYMEKLRKYRTDLMDPRFGDMSHLVLERINNVLEMAVSLQKGYQGSAPDEDVAAYAQPMDDDDEEFALAWNVRSTMDDDLEGDVTTEFVHDEPAEGPNGAEFDEEDEDIYDPTR